MKTDFDPIPQNVLDALGGQRPNGERLDAITRQIESSLTPVRSIPSRAAVISIALLVFIVFSLLAALPFGYFGLHVLSSSERLLYFGVLAILGILFSIGIDQEMAPGSKIRVSPYPLVSAAFCALCLTGWLLFPRIDMRNFVARGIPCLRLGLICAAICGVLAWILMRRGYSSSPQRTGVVTGCFAGLTGTAVLALHCGQQNAPHVLIWHFSAFAVAGIAGSLIGRWYSRRPQ